MRDAHTPDSPNVAARSLFLNTLLPLHNVLQKTGAGGSPVVFYREDRGSYIEPELKGRLFK